MNYRINTDKTAAVALTVEYQSMDTCPRGVRIIGLSKGCVARMDEYNGKTTDLIGWAPLPRIPQWMKEKSK
jgi:hypothetical protein